MTAAALWQLFASNLAARAGKDFLIDPEATATFAETAAAADRLAELLAVTGIEAGDRVVIQVRKGLGEVAAMLAVAKAGAVMVNVNTVWTADQVRFVANDCGARLLIVEPERAAALKGLGIGDSRLVVPGDGCAIPATRAAGKPPVACRAADDLAAIIYTSGSTGTPKGVMLSNANILAGARSVTSYLGLTGDDRLLSVLPYSFDYGLNQLTTMMLVGGSVVHQRLAMPTEIVRALQTHAVTGLAAVPPLWIQLVRLLEAAPAALPDLRFVTNSGGKIPLNILQAMPAVLPGVQVVLMYGLTEAFRSTYLDPARFVAKMGSIGRAIPGAQVHVIKHGVGIAGPGEQGELVHGGPLVCEGYWNRPDETAAKFRPCPELRELIGDQPVVYSGDIVRVDEDGDLWFVGRNDALIKTSGFRVSPDEVEDLVHRSGLVTDAVAFGVGDDVLGQTIQIAVTLRPGASREALAAHCRRTMPAYMVPRTIHLWPEPMPRTASGKLARPEVIRGCPAHVPIAAP